MKHILIKTATKLRDNIHTFKSVQSARKRVGMFHLMTKCVTEVEGTRVYLDDDVVLAYLATPSYQPNAMVTPSGDVVINTAASQLEPHILEALIFHEIGHIKYKHTAIPIIYHIQAVVGFGNGLKMEYEADAFAISKGAKVVEMLQTLQKSVENTRAIRLRIARAKALTNAI